MLQDSVINPLIVLIDLFHDPVLLMNKRGDKLLDYDSLQHNLDKTTEIDKIESLREQVVLAKRFVHWSVIILIHYNGILPSG